MTKRRSLLLVFPLLASVACGGKLFLDEQQDVYKGPGLPDETTCKTTLDCQVGNGELAACVAGTCVPRTNEAAGCTQVLGDVLADNTAILGVFTHAMNDSPVGRATARYGALHEQGMWLDLLGQRNASAGSVSATSPNFAVIVCEETKDPAGAVEFLKSAGASAILGPDNPDRLKPAAARAVEKDIAVVVPFDESATLVPGTFSLSGPRTSMANAAFAGIQDIAAKTRVDRGKTNLKIVVASSSLQADGEFRDAILPKLTAVADLTVKAIDASVSYTDAYALGGIDGRKISAEAPDIIVMNASWIQNSLVTYTEASWDTFAGGAARPIYVYVHQGDAGVEVQGSRGVSEPSVLGRSYLIDWNHDATADKSRTAVSQVMLGRKLELLLGSGLTSELANPLASALYVSALATQAKVARGHVAPASLASAAFREGLTLISERNAASFSINGPDLQTITALFDRGGPVSIVDTTGPAGWGPSGVRTGLTSVSLSCLDMQAKPNGWRTARVYSTTPGGSIDPIVCP